MASCLRLAPQHHALCGAFSQHQATQKPQPSEPRPPLSATRRPPQESVRRVCLSCTAASRAVAAMGPRSSGSLIGVPKSGSNPSPYQPFKRPPPTSPSTESLSVEEMLQILSEQRGLWHEFAPLITALGQQGFSSSIIAEATGISAADQNIMVVAAQVHNTLKQSACGALPYFDVGGAEVLYELRILAVNRRKDAAEYVAEQRLDGKGAREVARAMKEHERRKQEDGQGAFSTHPADCLAFAYYRQSMEARSASEKIAAMEKALSYASTEAATQKVKEALDRAVSPGRAPVADVTAARVPLVRLRTDETFPKPIPLLGSFHKLSPSAFQEAATNVGVTRKEGLFEFFSPTSNSVWMAVPSWPVVSAAAGPVAGVLVEDGSTVPVLKGRKISGPIVLVVDLGVAPGNEKDLFLIQEGEKVTLVRGAAGAATLAKVLLALLPPKAGSDVDDTGLDD